MPHMAATQANLGSKINDFFLLVVIRMVIQAEYDKFYDIFYDFGHAIFYFQNFEFLDRYQILDFYVCDITNQN